MGAVIDDRLLRQISFLVEADKLKGVLRRTPLVDSSRHENAAEHSWHLLLVALVMHEYADPDVDFLHVLEMLVVHDLVEIDAGDTFAYDDVGQASRAQREIVAADRIFDILPTDQTYYFRTLWEEFEAQETQASRLANAVDRFQPLLQNACSGGGTWRAHNLNRDQVLRRLAPVEAAIPRLWPVVVEIIDSFCESGLIRTTS